MRSTECKMRVNNMEKRRQQTLFDKQNLPGRHGGGRWLRLFNEVFLREASGTWEHLCGNNKMKAVHEKGTIKPGRALRMMQT